MDLIVYKWGKLVTLFTVNSSVLAVSQRCMFSIIFMHIDYCPQYCFSIIAKHSLCLRDYDIIGLLDVHSVLKFKKIDIHEY